MSRSLQEAERRLRTWVELSAFPATAALLALGCVRLLLSAAAACAELACDDFGRFWYATSGWLHDGRSLYAPTPASLAASGLSYPNLNLPHTHVLFLPFTLLPRDVAAAAWLIAGAAAVAATARMVAVETGWRPTLAWLLVFVWWMPTHVQVVTGQVAWLMLPVVAWAWRSARRGRWTTAGALVGIAVAMKPFLVPLVAWLAWRRRPAAVVAAIAAGGLTSTAGGLIFGVSSFVQWQEQVPSVDWFHHYTNASLWGIVYRLFTQNPQFDHVVLPTQAIPWLVGLLGAVVVLICWRQCRASNDVDRQWSLVLCASLLLSPLGWVYYGVWLLPGQHFKWPGSIATAFWLIPTPWLLMTQPSAVATLLWGSAATWGLVLAFVHIARTAPALAVQANRLEAVQ